MAKKRRVYGDLTSLADISDINNEIRKEIASLVRVDAISERVRRSQYLYTLLFSDNVKKHFRGKVQAARTRAKNQYTTTARFANLRMKQLGSKKRFDTKIN